MTCELSRYSAGLGLDPRGTMTPEQQSLVDRISAVLGRDARIEAAWLAGSLGRDEGDAFSDVDVVVLCPDGLAIEIAAAPGLLDFAQPVLVNALYGGRILNVITPDWQRFDLVFVEASDLARYNANDLKPLFNRTGGEPPRTESAPHQTTPDGLAKLVQEFFRVLSLGPLGIGREEYIVALSGIELLRRMTVDLMLEENGVGRHQRGGALRLNPFLTSEQIKLLQSLPAVAAERESLLRCQKAIAGIFVPRAKALAARIGMEWPSALEAASRAHLKSQLDFEF
jgi:predicted nucleotidyltransferase